MFWILASLANLHMHMSMLWSSILKVIILLSKYFSIVDLLLLLRCGCHVVVSVIVVVLLFLLICCWVVVSVVVIIVIVVVLLVALFYSYYFTYIQYLYDSILPLDHVKATKTEVMLWDPRLVVPRLEIFILDMSPATSGHRMSIIYQSVPLS